MIVTNLIILRFFNTRLKNFNLYLFDLLMEKGMSTKSSDVKTTDKKSQLVDFDYIGDSSHPDDIIDAFLAGKEQYIKEFRDKITKGLQISAVSSSLFRSKLSEIPVNVRDMYLRILGFEDFECLVIVDDNDYYEKDKRWKSYDVSRNVNSGLDDLNITFSLMPFSEKIRNEVITSEGFYFKYGSK